MRPDLPFLASGLCWVTTQSLTGFCRQFSRRLVQIFQSDIGPPSLKSDYGNISTTLRSVKAPKSWSCDIPN